MYLSPYSKGLVRHCVQASWNHWPQLPHCNIFRFHLQPSNKKETARETLNTQMNECVQQHNWAMATEWWLQHFIRRVLWSHDSQLGVCFILLAVLHKYYIGASQTQRVHLKDSLEYFYFIDCISDLIFDTQNFTQRKPVSTDWDTSDALRALYK